VVLVVSPKKGHYWRHRHFYFTSEKSPKMVGSRRWGASMSQRRSGCHRKWSV